MTLILQVHLLIISATTQSAILLSGLQTGVFLQGLPLSLSPPPPPSLYLSSHSISKPSEENVYHAEIGGIGKFFG